MTRTAAGQGGEIRKAYFKCQPFSFKFSAVNPLRKLINDRSQGFINGFPFNIPPKRFFTADGLTFSVGGYLSIINTSDKVIVGQTGFTEQFSQS